MGTNRTRYRGGLTRRRPLGVDRGRESGGRQRETERG